MITSTFSRPLQRSFVSIAILFAMGCAGPSLQDEQTRSASSTKTHAHEVDSQIEQKLTEPLQTSEAEAIVLSAARTIDGRYKRETDRSALAPASSRLLRHPGDALMIHAPFAENNTETYQDIEQSGVKLTRLAPVSTFSIDVDTGSYTNARRMLQRGIMPPSDAVRIEEFLNYFDYGYSAPKELHQPFSVNTAVSTAPWDAQKHIVRIGLKGYQPDSSKSAGSNLVFLLDVSGSMNQSDKLPLLKRSLSMLTSQLTENDKVSIVVYAGASGVVLSPTNGNDKLTIENALNALQAGGSTNGAAGIEQAYQIAQSTFIKGGVNRVILATDGDFNVGISDHNALIELITQKREKGIALTTLGFGQGNYNDYLMEQLANAGNGNYAYIDNINEARKVLVDELQSTMQMIAQDVKIQVEFNPEVVAEYRLIGYDNRALANEDFNNDKVDAGDIGAGHQVTALYEITLVESDGKFNDDLRYAKPATNAHSTNLNELAHVKLRFKQPHAKQSQLIEQIVYRDEITNFEQQSGDFKFAVAVASFAERIKQSKYTQNLDYQWIASTARQVKGDDVFGYRSEFIQLVNTADALK
ncbi:von Willebrand factor type A domain-containing protein [Glaciecola sp. SC05]|uniref:vWA domain-containing protein n=1 Tax=Glaciecola sp. SC05 TaxID=1987355 RepID=UPI0035294679